MDAKKVHDAREGKDMSLRAPTVALPEEVRKGLSVDNTSG
jgi:hypothetical protein